MKAGWQIPGASHDFEEHGMPKSYPVAYYRTKARAEDAAGALKRRTRELAQAALNNGDDDDDSHWLYLANPCFFLVSEHSLPRDQIIYLRDRINRLADPSGTTPQTTEEAFANFLRDRIKRLADPVDAKQTKEEVFAIFLRDRIKRLANPADETQTKEKAFAIFLLERIKRLANPAATTQTNEEAFVRYFLPKWLQILSEIEKSETPPRMTKEEANRKAMELAKRDRTFVDRPLREWAEAIGCSEGLVTKLPFWIKTMEMTGRGQKDRPRVPKAVTFTDTLESTTGKGKPNQVLDELIAEQDQEPSPLEADPQVDRPRRVRNKKRV